MVEKTAKFEVEITESEVRDLVKDRVALALKGHYSADEDGDPVFIPDTRVGDLMREEIARRIGDVAQAKIQEMVEAEVLKTATEGFRFTDHYGREQQRKTLHQLVSEALAKRDDYRKESRVEVMLQEEVQKALAQDFAEVTKSLRERFASALEKEFAVKMMETLRGLGSR